MGAATPLFGSAGPLITSGIGLAVLALGAGIGLGWPHLNNFVLTFTRAEERDMAASALSTVQMSAVAFGTAVAGLAGNFSGLKDARNQSVVPTEHRSPPRSRAGPQALPAAASSSCTPLIFQPEPVSNIW